MGGYGSGRPRGKARTTDFTSVDIRKLEKGLLATCGGQISFWVRGVLRTAYLQETPCQYGGVRYWFECPHCRGRAAVLYASGDGFACRKCRGLAYPSQSEDALSRSLSKSGELMRRLAAGKPKRMRWRTWERIIEDAERAGAGAVALIRSKGWAR